MSMKELAEHIVSVPSRGDWGVLQEVTIMETFTINGFPSPLEVTGVSYPLHP